MRRALSTPAATAAFFSTLLLIGIVGWSAGWLVAGTEIDRLARTDPTTSPSPTARATVSTSPSPARSGPSKSPTPSPTRTDAFALPDLKNMPFLEARKKAFALKLGVNLHFNEPALLKSDGTVIRTYPAEDTLVWPGIAVQLYVKGSPPPTTVPEVLGKSCDDAKDLVLDAGLVIDSYPSGPRGTLTKMEPAPGTRLRWNDKVKLTCTP